ncbi:MAG TPA: glycosyltransferase family 39 protein [Solirubrobacteraceae bacterium]|nr:glycosyltransferase family 39 protein [Solirubrobacteraceae bacterium]
MPGGTQGLSVAAPGASRSGVATRSVSTVLLRPIPWTVVAITVVAAVLRFVGLAGVSANEFYDAAVRSMGMSFHNFFFGAFDPSSILSIDKPPVDLWLQVISVKLFGWGSFALKLPEALAGTLAVPLLYDAVRRAIGRPAGIAAAAVLALAPQSVLTARSDTMDSVMMLLVIAAVWLTLRAVSEPERRRRFVVLAAVAMGLAFNVKLLESTIALPALLALYLLAADGPRRRKAIDVALAAVTFVGVGLSWAILATIAPGSHPWAVGSSDGSVWNAMFVFNGVGRASTSGSPTSGGPGLLRLFEPSGWHFDVLFGSVIIAAVALGAAAVIATVVRQRHDRPSAAVLPRAFAISIAVWIAFAVIVFDGVGTMHTRYLEVLSPALAVAIGWGAVTLAGLYGRFVTPSLPAIVLALVAVCLYVGGLHPVSIATAGLALIVAIAGAVRLTRLDAPIAGPARWLTAALIIACAMVFPVHESVKLVRTQSNDSLGLAAYRPGATAILSAFLRPRTTQNKYELAVDEPLSLAPLIIRDQRPILPLTTFGGRPLTTVATLRRAIAAGQLRYGLVNNLPCTAATEGKAYCAPAARWIRAHGVDVSADAGLRGHSRLYRLS